MAGEASLVLDLAGPVRLTGPDCVELTPKARRARGMLALLGTARGLERSRDELRAKLWHRAGPQAGGASLRGALCRLRRGLGDHAEVLRLEGGMVGLDPERVRVVLPVADGTAGEVEFAAGVDVPEPPFEAWLRERRAAFAVRGGAEPAGSLVLAIDAALDCPTTGLLMEAAYRVVGLVPLEVRLPGAPGGAEPDLVLRSRRSEPAGRPGLALTDPARGTLLWAGSMPGGAAALAEAILPALHHHDRARPHLAAMLTTDVPRLHAALAAVLRRAGEDRAEGLELAWASYALNTIVTEVPGPGPERDGAVRLIARAVESAPGCAAVHALAAQVAASEDEPAAALRHLQVAERLDPDGAMVRFSRSSVLSAQGRDHEAYEAALAARATPLGVLAPARLDMRCAVNALRAGLLDEALALCRAATGMLPSWRHAWRFRAAVAWELGHVVEAERALRRLARLEPDFRLARLEQEDYPVPCLRQHDLLGVARSGLAA